MDAKKSYRTQISPFLIMTHTYFKQIEHEIRVFDWKKLTIEV